MTDKDPFKDGQGTRIAGKNRNQKPTGAGAEAAEGLHARPEGRTAERDESDRTSLDERETGDDGAQRGSEPLPESDQHRSAYGGDAGEPKPGYAGGSREGGSAQGDGDRATGKDARDGDTGRAPQR